MARARRPRRGPDPTAIHNERMKLLASYMNALSIGLVGFALLRPLVENLETLNFTTLWWCGLAFAFHGLAHYILGRIEKEAPDDSL